MIAQVLISEPVHISKHVFQTLHDPHTSINLVVDILPSLIYPTYLQITANPRSHPPSPLAHFTCQLSFLCCCELRIFVCSPRISNPGFRSYPISLAEKLSLRTSIFTNTKSNFVPWDKKCVGAFLRIFFKFRLIEHFSILKCVIVGCKSCKAS